MCHLNLRVPLVLCPGIQRYLGHKEVIVVCGGFLAGREKGSVHCVE